MKKAPFHANNLSKVPKKVVMELQRFGKETSQKRGDANREARE